MKKVIFWICILTLASVSVSFADFQSELDSCGSSKSPESCYQKVRTKYVVSKKKACSMKDGEYNLPLEIKWPGKKVSWNPLLENFKEFVLNTSFKKQEWFLSYNVVAEWNSSYDQKIYGTYNYYFLYECKTGKIINLDSYKWWLKIKNMWEDWCMINKINNKWALISCSCGCDAYPWREGDFFANFSDKSIYRLSEAIPKPWSWNTSKRFNVLGKDIKKLPDYKELKQEYNTESLDSYNYYKEYNKKNNKDIKISLSDYQLQFNPFINYLFWWFLLLERGNFNNNFEWEIRASYYDKNSKLIKKLAKSKINLLTKTITVE